VTTNSSVLNPSRVLDLVHDFYRTLESMDREAEIARSNVEVACQGPGCCGCCYQLVSIQSFEALGLGLAALQRPDWEQHAQQLAWFSRPFLRLDMTYDEYFDARILCCYGRDGPCSIYPARPIMCRFYWVAGHDPRVCWPGGRPNALDLRGVHHKARAWSRAAALELHIPDFLGPLAPMVLWAMELLGGPGHREVLTGLAQNRPNVIEWSQRAVTRIPREA
jgi:hypothetical protein